MLVPNGGWWCGCKVVLCWCVGVVVWLCGCVVVWCWCCSGVVVDVLGVVTVIKQLLTGASA